MSRQIRPYWDFLAAVQAVQRSWEAISPTFSPGWTPAEWAEDLTGLITASIWNQEHAPLHERIISMLEKRRNPDICSGNFPSFELLRGEGTRSELAHYAHNRFPWTSWLHSQVVRTLVQYSDAPQTPLSEHAMDVARLWRTIGATLDRLGQFDTRHAMVSLIESFKSMVGKWWNRASNSRERSHVFYAVQSWVELVERVESCVAVASVLLPVYLPSEQKFAHQICNLPLPGSHAVSPPVFPPQHGAVAEGHSMVPHKAHGVFAVEIRAGPAFAPVLATPTFATPYSHQEQHLPVQSPHQLPQHPGLPPQVLPLLNPVKSLYRAQLRPLATEAQNNLHDLIFKYGPNEPKIPWLLRGLSNLGEHYTALPLPTNVPRSRAELEALYEYSQNPDFHDPDFSFYSNPVNFLRYRMNQ